MIDIVVSLELLRAEHFGLIFCLSPYSFSLFAGHTRFDSLDAFLHTLGKSSVWMANGLVVIYVESDCCQSGLLNTDCDSDDLKTFT